MPLPRWMPDLASLDLLLSVAELGSVGKAASAHGITQPSASSRLNRLERQVGLSLLARTTTGSALTPAGAAFVAWATKVVAAAQSLCDDVTALQDTRSARLRVAASLTVAEYLLPSWLLRLRRAEPQLEVTAAVANSAQVCERVRDGSVEIGFVESPTVPADLSAKQVGVDHLVLVAAPTFPAARRRTPLPVRDLLGQPLLLREPGSGTRETFLDAVRDAIGGEPALRDATHLGSTATILAAARAGGGIGVISSRAAQADLASGGLVAVPVAGLATERALHAVWTGRRVDPVARSLLAVATADAGQ